MSMFYELMMRKKEEIMYATIKGTLTENDGVFSGFAYNNYLATQEEFDCSKDFEIALKINTGNIKVTDNLKTIARNSFGSSAGRTGFAFGISSVDKKAQAFIFDSSGYQFVNRALGITVFDNYTDYFIKFSQKYNGVAYITKIESSTDGINWITENSWTHNLPIRNSGQGVAFGGGKLSQISQYWAGSIDLNNSYIKIGSTKYNLQAVVGYTIVGSPTIVDGVVSGFSSANYLYLPSAPSWSNIDILETFTTFTTSTMNTLQIVMGSRYSQATCCVEITSANKTLFRITYIDSGGTTRYKETTINYVLSANTKYKVKNYFNKQTLVIKSELYDENGIILASASSSLASDYTSIANINDFWYGYNPQRGTFSGSIDFNNNNTYIKINNKLWFNGQQA